MKDFLKIMLASALGFIIANIIFYFIAMILFFGAMGSMVGSLSSEKFTLQDNSVLHLRLNSPITERIAEEDPFTSLFSSDLLAPMGLNDIVSAIRKAKNVAHTSHEPIAAGRAQPWASFRCHVATAI